MKFKIGNRVEQICSGYNTNPQDNGKQAIVTEVGLKYSNYGDGIKIKTIGVWKLCDAYPRGEDAFKKVYMEPFEEALEEAIRLMGGAE